VLGFAILVGLGVAVSGWALRPRRRAQETPQPSLGLPFNLWLLTGHQRRDKIMETSRRPTCRLTFGNLATTSNLPDMPQPAMLPDGTAS
jgi:hypothetical protein